MGRGGTGGDGIGGLGSWGGGGTGGDGAGGLGSWGGEGGASGGANGDGGGVSRTNVPLIGVSASHAAPSRRAALNTNPMSQYQNRDDP